MTGEAPPPPWETGQQGTVGAGNHHLLCPVCVCVSASSAVPRVCVCVCVCIICCAPCVCVCVCVCLQACAALQSLMRSSLRQHTGETTEASGG